MATSSLVETYPASLKNLYNERKTKLAELKLLEDELATFLADKPAPRRPVHNDRGDLLEQGFAPPDELIVEVQRKLFNIDFFCYQNGLPLRCYNLEQIYHIISFQKDLECAPLPREDWVPVPLDTLEKLNAEYRRYMVKESGEFRAPIRYASRPIWMLGEEERRLCFRIDSERNRLGLPLRFFLRGEFEKYLYSE